MTKKTKAKPARPTVLGSARIAAALELDAQRAHAQAITDAIAEGTSLRQAAAAQGVGVSTFLDWVSKDPALAEHYARAREAGLERLAEEILEIADAPAETQVDVGQARNRIDARKWILSKLLPRRYGDKVDVTSDGEKLAAPQIMVIAGREVTF